MTVQQAKKWIERLSAYRLAGDLTASEVRDVINTRAIRLASFGADPSIVEFLQEKRAEWLVISEREFGDACREMMS